MRVRFRIKVKSRLILGIELGLVQCCHFRILYRPWFLHITTIGQVGKHYFDRPLITGKKSMRITLSLTITIMLTLLTLTVTVRVTLTLPTLLTLLLETVVNKAPTYTSMHMYFSCD